MNDWQIHTERLIYNGARLDKQAILNMNEQGLEQWEIDIIRFMKQWVTEVPYIVVNTSGSTGSPKMIRLAKSTMVHSAKMTCKYLNLSADRKALLCLPVKYIGGKMMIVRAFVCQWDLHTIKPSSLIQIENSFDFVAMTPHQLEISMKNQASITNRFSTIILGGSQPSFKLVNNLRSTSTDCYLTYGMTETSSHIALKKLNGSDASKYFEVIDNQLSIDQDDSGCLRIHAPYLGNKWIKTNDQVEILDAHHFNWLGRKDHVINSGGIKLHPELIEQKLAPYFPFRFIIFGQSHERYGERPCLLIENSESISSRAIWTVLKKHLSKLEQPEAIYFIDQLELTENGKINREASIQKLKNID